MSKSHTQGGRIVVREPVTIWKKFYPADGNNPEHWEHNHIEDVFVESSSPVPKFKSQQGWVKGKWRKIHGHLENGALVEGNND